MNNKIKIAFISKFFCTGGVPRSYLSIAEGLKDNGFEFHIINIQKDDFQERFRKCGKCVYLPHAQDVIDYLQENKIQIAHTNNCDRGSYLAYLAGVPRIIERLAGMNTAFLFDRKPVDCVIGSTPMGYNFSKTEYPNKHIELIYNGVDTHRFFKREKNTVLLEKYGINPQNTVIGYLGRISREKCIDKLLVVFHQLLKKNKNLNLILAGKVYPDYVQIINETLDKYNLREPVVFTGETESPHEIINLFDIGVNCSGTYIAVDGSEKTTREGLSNSIMEILACGVPVVATASGETSTLVRDNENGFLSDVDDMSAMLDNLNRLISDSNLRRRLGDKARETMVSEFNLDKMTDEYERVYRFVLSDEFKKIYPHSRTEAKTHFLANPLQWDCPTKTKKKILVFRSGSTHLFNYIIKDIQNNFKNAQISVLCHEKNFGEIIKYHQINEFYVYTLSENFELNRMGDFVDIINRNGYDIFYFIMNDFFAPDFEYANIKNIARSIKSDIKIVVNCFEKKYLWQNEHNGQANFIR